MPDTIRFRIALVTGGLSLLLILGFSLFLYFNLYWGLYGFVDKNLRSRTDLLLESLIKENGKALFDRKDIFDYKPQEDDSAQLVSLSGALMDQLGEEYVPAASLSIYPTNKVFTYRFIEIEGPEKKEDNEIFRLLIVPVTDQGKVIAYLQVGHEIDDVQEALMRLVQLLLFTGPVLVGIASFGGYWLTGKALAPIEAIRRKADSIQANDLHQRLDVTIKDEVGQLARTFNEMLDRLEESFQRQRRFTADASHELRTPLTVIQSEVEIALNHPRSQAEYMETLQSIGMEAQRMNRLANELLLLARADAHQMQLTYEKVDLVDLLKLLEEHMQNQAEISKVDLIEDLPSSLQIDGDRDRLTEMLINLLENIFYHAPGSKATICARLNKDQAEILLKDNGPGIGAEHLAHIFERFYRVDQVRGKSRDRSGLGLAIAQEIATAHGGHISMQSELGKGTTVTVRIPAGSRLLSSG
jgi:heavy metal sensor kinase